MEVKISEQKENKLLNRKELHVHIDNNGATPKSEDIAGKVAALLNVEKNLVVVETVHQYFGVKKAEAHVKVYKTLEDLQKTEPKEKKEKAPAAEKPAEQKKEEVKPA